MYETEDEKIYTCPECGLHYADEQITKQCQLWCAEHKSCNLEIAEHSIEKRSAK